MDVGYGGVLGCFEFFKEVVMDYVFLFDLEGIKE